MTKYNIIVKEVNAILDQYSSLMTLRQIYYRLVAKLIIPNTISQYKGLSRHLVKARERREVDYRRIEDRMRTTLGGDYGNWTVCRSDPFRFNVASYFPKLEDAEPEHFKEAAQIGFEKAYRAFTMSYWQNQPEIVEVWIEKDALARLASETADNLNVRTCPSRGYSSFSYIMKAVNRLRGYGDKDITILYLGDFDPSGLDITRDLQRRLTRYGATITMERLALSAEQIQEYQLPPMPAKTSDPRYWRFVEETGASEAVELDALEPPTLQRIIKDGINDHIELDLWTERQNEITEKREQLREEFENLEISWG